jgi:hypothetical protein
MNDTIFRFKFNEDICEKLNNFAKIHKYDKVKDFKEAWILWVEENNEIIQNEIRFLNNLGYEGDIIDKMYKSARYYYRKKVDIKKEPKKRRNYIKIQDKDFINEVDKHIKNSCINGKIKPSKNFNEFCELNPELINHQINTLNNELSNEEIILKLKKTYKNRYFLEYK